MKIAQALLIIFAIASPVLCAGDSPQTLGDAYPYLCSGVLQHAVLARIPGQTVASSGTIKVTRKDIDAAIARQPEQQRDQVKLYPIYVVEKTIAEKLIAQEARVWAKKNGRAPDVPSSIEAYVTSQIPKQSITDAEVEAFYKDNSAMVGGTPFEQVKDVMASFLMSEKTDKARGQFISAAGKRHKVLVSSDWAKTQHDNWSANPVEKARVSGKPSLVIFSVIGCCDKMHPVFQTFDFGYSEKVNSVFVNTREAAILSQLYGVSTVPVELMFDAAGKEIFRHTGFMSLDGIAAQFKASGIDLTGAQ